MNCVSVSIKLDAFVLFYHRTFYSHFDVKTHFFVSCQFLGVNAYNISFLIWWYEMCVLVPHVWSRGYYGSSSSIIRVVGGQGWLPRPIACQGSIIIVFLHLIITFVKLIVTIKHRISNDTARSYRLYFSVYVRCIDVRSTIGSIL